jgi:hypothetical protein
VIGSPAGISTVPRSSAGACDAGGAALPGASLLGASLPAGVEAGAEGDAAPGVEQADSASSAVRPRAPTLANFIQSPPGDAGRGGSVNPASLSSCRLRPAPDTAMGPPTALSTLRASWSPPGRCGDDAWGGDGEP